MAAVPPRLPFELEFADNGSYAAAAAATAERLFSDAERVALLIPDEDDEEDADGE